MRPKQFPWFVSLLATGIVTLAVGLLLSMIVNVALPPLVSVCGPEVGATFDGGGVMVHIGERDGRDA